MVTGDLSFLSAYRGDFAILATDGMENERRDGGYNSSTVLWEAGSKATTDIYEVRKHGRGGRCSLIITSLCHSNFPLLNRAHLLSTVPLRNGCAGAAGTIRARVQVHLQV